MPKGGDLHNHLSGAIYAESYLRWAAEDNLCLATATMTIVAGAVRRRRPAGRRSATCCRTRRSSTRRSTRCRCGNWNPALNGHDHFFATFDKFGAAVGDQARRHARRGRRRARRPSSVSYLELMLTPDRRGRRACAGRPPGGTPTSPTLRERLLGAGFDDASSPRRVTRIDVGGSAAAQLLRLRRRLRPTPAAASPIRYIAQVARAGAPESVFAQMLAGFEIAVRGRHALVGVNLVQPEDDPDCGPRFLAADVDARLPARQSIRAVPITLHAGELDRRARAARDAALPHPRIGARPATRAASATAPA